MSKADSYDRFLELDAGRALGDLSEEEMKEWQELAPQYQDTEPTGFDYLVSELEIHHTEESSIPPSLKSKLTESIPSSISKEGSEGRTENTVVSIFPWLGWVAAACLFFFLNPSGDDPAGGDVEFTPAQKLEALITEAPDATQKLAFAPGGDSYKEIQGEVMWNDERQEGYMKLSSLPLNDPSKNQYQLWIVDPERDELPVDGGVFDISSADGAAVIPIRNTLPISNPVAFVITLEQPGGVVRSKQEVVVALAKSS